MILKNGVWVAYGWHVGKEKKSIGNGELERLVRGSGWDLEAHKEGNDSYI